MNCQICSSIINVSALKQNILTCNDFRKKIGVSRSETGNTMGRVSRFKYRKLGGFPGNFQLYCILQSAFVITHLVNPRVKHRVSRYVNGFPGSTFVISKPFNREKHRETHQNHVGNLVCRVKCISIELLSC